MIPATLKVWLDDVRKPPQGWVWCTTPTQVLTLVDAGVVCELSLDHDLGDDAGIGTGYDVVVGLEDRWAEILHGLSPKQALPDPQRLLSISTIRCHSANPVGRKRIESVVASLERAREIYLSQHPPSSA